MEYSVTMQSTNKKSAKVDRPYAYQQSALKQFLSKFFDNQQFQFNDLLHMRTINVVSKFYTTKFSNSVQIHPHIEQLTAIRSRMSNSRLSPIIQQPGEGTAPHNLNELKSIEEIEPKSISYTEPAKNPENQGATISHADLTPKEILNAANQFMLSSSNSQGNNSNNNPAKEQSNIDQFNIFGVTDTSLPAQKQVPAENKAISVLQDFQPCDSLRPAESANSNVLLQKTDNLNQNGSGGA